MSTDPMRAAIQNILDTAGDGWTLAHYVICMGLERLAPDGTVESGFWLYPSPNQPAYITDGLLQRALEDDITVDEDHD